MFRQLTFFEATSLLVGAVVGAGFLGIPFVVAHTGFTVGLLLILIVGLLVMIEYLAVTEITLRTHAKHQIGGYISKYLGHRWRRIVEALIILEGYGVMLAYLVGEGRVLSAVFGGNQLWYSLAFLAVIAFLLFYGLRLVERVELLLTMLMMIGIVLLVSLSTGSIDPLEYSFSDYSYILPAYGVILFSFLGVNAIPEMRLATNGKERILPKAVIAGTLIPMIVYVLFTGTVVGVTGMHTSEIATVGLGEKLGSTVMIVGNLLAAITMTTAFLALGLSLKETYRYDLKFHKNQAFFLTILGPLVLLVLGVNSFIEILLFVGAVFGGLKGIILVLTWWKAAKHGDRKPEFVLNHKHMFGWALILVFTVGVVYTLLDIGGHI